MIVRIVGFAITMKSVVVVVVVVGEEGISLVYNNASNECFIQKDATHINVYWLRQKVFIIEHTFRGLPHEGVHVSPHCSG